MKLQRTNATGRKILDKLQSVRPFVQGSVYDLLTRCGNPVCRCRREGPIHPITRLSWKEGGRTRTIKVPPELKEEVTAWVAEFKRVKELLKEFSNEQREFLKALKRRLVEERRKNRSSKRST